MKLSKIIIDKDRCKGCGLCIEVCPKKVLFFDNDSVNVLGYHPVAAKEGCIACGFCATVCPDVVFTIYREEKGGK
ncbi:4Fe-4S binding protein [Thermovorax subterraneus]|uniref:4Fe-4S dicluster domain-containing protein n=1 Tax=Caldanaerovirga acetigignens TaxID=447595 RepID=UPI001F24D99A|nr:4Fe-4S dicluster domain-containing protein [Caldanaerovirga acetigignens]MCF6096004.1 4Fe-4S binding protein [Thermovorax subterraneus]